MRSRDYIEGVSEQEHERLMACGLRDPFRLEWEREHDDDLDARDRKFEKGGEAWRTYARQPHQRERDLHRQAA